MEKSGLSPDEAIMVGDTPYDMEAARKCGLRFIGMLSGGWTVKDFPKAYAVYNSLIHLRESLVMPASSR